MTLNADYDPYILQVVKPAVARLRIPEFGVEGTGFLVEGDQVVTCCHVVERIDTGGEVLCSFGETRVERTAKLTKSDKDTDVAVLKLTQHLEVTPLKIAKAGQRFHEWLGYGFPAFTQGVGVPLVGSLLDPAVRDRENRAAMQLAAQMLTGEDVSLGGLSGTPIVSGNTVVGMLYRVLGAKGDWSATHFGLLFAVPHEILAPLIGGHPVPTYSDWPMRDDDSRTSELITLMGRLRFAGSPREVRKAIAELKAADLLLPEVIVNGAEMLLDMGAPRDALGLLKGMESREHAAQLKALAFSLLGDHQKAAAVLSNLGTSAETGGIAGGILKRRYLETLNPNLLISAFAQYESSFQLTRDPYPGINAASLALWKGDGTRSRAIAQEVLVIGEGKPSKERDHWDWATLGEAHLLLGQMDDAIQCYEMAVAKNPSGARVIASMRANVRRNLQHLRLKSVELERMLCVGTVACITGHRVDEGNRVPRFPQKNVTSVARAIKGVVRELGIRYGFGSAACGADLLFAEALLEVGAEVTICLPFPVEDFVKASVGDEWRRRFERVLHRLPAGHLIVINGETPHTEEERNEAFGRCNEYVHQLAADTAGILDQRPVLVAVVVPSDDPAARGGTHDAIDLWRELDRGELVEINPLTVTGN